MNFGEGIRVTWFPTGGGAVPDSGQLPGSWTLQQSPLSTVTLAPRRAAVLLR